MSGVFGPTAFDTLQTYEQIFTEFEGVEKPGETMGDGDVQYHLGYTSRVETEDGRSIYLKLSPNPSHLEAVNPVVLGYTRAVGNGGVTYLALGHCHNPASRADRAADVTMQPTCRGAWVSDGFTALLRNAIAWGTR